MKIAELLSADWSKDAKKRACCRVEVGVRRVSFLDESDLTFERLLQHASSEATDGITCISLDLAIGVPAAFLERYRLENASEGCGFLAWLARHHDDECFWLETNRHAEWSTARPFIAVPKGKGSLTAFKTAAGHDLRREIDRDFGAKSPFIVSGIPGTVGSGTRSFWRELAPKLSGDRDFRVWPFEGNFERLTRTARILVAETYPAICYTAVLAEELPGPQWLLAKTKQDVRHQAIDRLGELGWIKQAGLCLPDLEVCIDSEDYFDALMAGLAQYRLLHTTLGLFDEARCDAEAEGGILGSTAIEPGKKRRWP